jgi:hypothetical protein
LNAAVGDQWRIAYAEKVRSEMGSEMCAVADALRETFDAKLTWLETSTMTVGTEPEWGVPSQWTGGRRRA